MLRVWITSTGCGPSTWSWAKTEADVTRVARKLVREFRGGHIEVTRDGDISCTWRPSPDLAEELRLLNAYQRDCTTDIGCTRDGCRVSRHRMLVRCRTADGSGFVWPVNACVDGVRNETAREAA